MNLKVPKASEFPIGQAFQPDKPSESDSHLVHLPDKGNLLASAVPDSSPENDQILADLVEELAAHLHSGGSVDWQACARDYPQYVEQLRVLLPALEALAATPKSNSGPTSSNNLAPSRQGAKVLSDFAALRETFGHQPSSLQSPSSTGTLGDFRLIREIGRGGMGVVYEAEQISLGRRVALKILPFAAALDSRHLQRFK